MPKAERSNPKDKDAKPLEGPRHRPHWLAAFTCLVFGILLAVALIDFEPAQSIQNTTNPTSINLVGVIGAEFSWWIYHLLGVSTWLLPIFLLWMASIYLRSARSLATTRLIAMLCCVVSFAPLMAMQDTFFTNKSIFTAGPGGVLGRLIYQDVLKDSLGVFGSLLILGTVYFLGMLFIFTRDIAAECTRLINHFTEWRQQRAALKAAQADELRQQRAAAAQQKTAAAAAALTPATPPPTISVSSIKKVATPKADIPVAEPNKVTPPPSFPKPTAKAAAPASDPQELARAMAGKIALNIVKLE
ncbi:MAG: hypothetical protein EBT89_11475, partial [Opitutaceae bacterium]|nr:hypothetical protein [Opitutaceae bacterium]